MRVAIVGAGPAGGRAAVLLASAGHDVRLFDTLSPWEKPCGGGVTTRALDLGDAVPRSAPRQPIARVCLYYGDNHVASLEPEKPLVVLSRKSLGEHLLSTATEAGARFVADRVVGLDRHDGRWTIETRSGSYEADYVVGADGASSFVRRRTTVPFDGRDLSVTLGYFIAGETSEIMKIFFVPDLEGYVWSFPRPDHLSYGLITRPGPRWTSIGKALLENYVTADLGEDVLDRAVFYSAPVPTLRPEAWDANVINGSDWALVGDAAGLVDPITGEGIYYALRSAELLADAFPDLEAYGRVVRHQLGGELMRAARLYRMFYSGRFLGASFRKRLVQLTDRSPTIRRSVGNLIAGAQPYHGLRRKLLRAAPRVGFEVLRSQLGWRG